MSKNKITGMRVISVLVIALSFLFSFNILTNAPAAATPPAEATPAKYTAIAQDIVTDYNLDLRTFAVKNPQAVILIGILLVIALSLLRTKGKAVLTGIYMLFILFETLLVRNVGGVMKLTPFWSYKLFFSNYDIRLCNLHNIWLFVPLGAGLYALIRKRQKAVKTLLIAIALSVVIEACQYLFALGTCDIDDVISNTIGAGLGIILYTAVTSFTSRGSRVK